MLHAPARLVINSHLEYPIAMTVEEKSAALRAIENGNNKEARRILRSLVHAAPDDWSLWWYLSLATDEIEQKLLCVKQVLRLNPNHAQAARLLQELDRKIARPTPTVGTRRPVYESPRRDKEKQHILLSLPRIGHVQEIESTAMRPLLLFTLAAVLLGLTIFIAAGFVNGTFHLTGDASKSTKEALSVVVEGCLSGGNATTLTFKNRSANMVSIFAGEVGAERLLFDLPPTVESTLDVSPDTRTRYFARSELKGLSASGAVIQVPAGSSCSVIIK